MKRFIPAITLLVSLSLESSLHAGWGSKKDKTAPKNTSADTQPAVKTPGFNLEDNRSGFVELDYLFWRPQMEDCFFAMKNTPFRDGTLIGSSKLKQPNFDLSSGVRLGVGGFTSDSWDVGLKGTYLFSDANKKTNAEGSLATGLVLPQWMRELGTGTKGSAHWKMNFYTLDLSFGREYFMTKKFAVHPFIGLRGFHIKQSLHDHYHSIFQATINDPLVAATTKFRAKQSLWGVGPRLGMDLSFYFVQEWAFLGGFSGSLLYTRSKIKEKMFGQHFVSPNTTTSPFNIFVKDKDTFGRANLDVYFGMGWDRWFNQGKQRVSLSLLFEGSQWFQMNQWVDIDTANFDSTVPHSNASILETKRHGDLSFIGGTVRLGIDF